MKKIHFSRHANIRLKEPRQKGIVKEDVIRACYKSKEELKYMRMGDTEKVYSYARSGRRFSFVVSKRNYGLKIITIIGLGDEDEWGNPYVKKGTKMASSRKDRQRTRKARWKMGYAAP